MKIAIVAAGFSPGEADKLRRAMATFRRVGTIHTFHEKMVNGMTERGYDPDFADRCFRQIEGFGEYGFPESHAASFALLVYASCWLKCHYPDAFAAAIINSQPMGFYSPAQLVRDAREHGVEVRPPDVNWSDYDCTLEPCTREPGGPESDGEAQSIHPRHSEMAKDIRATHAVRLGLRKIKGVGEDEATLVMKNRATGYTGVRDLWLRAGLSRRTMEKLADADAFRSIGLSRRDALWQVRALDDGSVSNDLPVGLAGDKADSLPLFTRGENRYADLRREPPVALPQMPESEEVIQDYRSLSLSLKAHPVSFLREELAATGITPNVRLEEIANGRWAEIAGLVAVRQRPGSAKGVVFMTLEDETGIANVIVWPKTFEIFRATVMSSRLVRVRGRLQKADGVTHLVADRLTDITPMLVAVTEQGIFDANQGEMVARALDFGGLANADEVKNPIEDVRQVKSPLKRTRELMHKEAVNENASASASPRQMRLPWKTPPGRRRQAVKRTAAAMPKGRNFH